MASFLKEHFERIDQATSNAKGSDIDGAHLEALHMMCGDALRAIEMDPEHAKIATYSDLIGQQFAATMKALGLSDILIAHGYDVPEDLPEPQAA